MRANLLANIAVELGVDTAMIGGAPYLMSALERALRSRGIAPVYSFSTRTVEIVGYVKTSVFKHTGWVSP